MRCTVKCNQKCSSRLNEIKVMQNDYLSPQQLHFRKQNNTAYTAQCVVSKNHFENDFFCKVSFSISCFPSFWAQSYTNTLMDNSRASYSTVFISFTKSSLNLKGKEPVHFCVSFFLYLTSRLHLFVFKSASHEHSLLALGSTGHFPWGGSWLNSLFFLHGKTYELAGPFIHTQP